MQRLFLPFFADQSGAQIAARLRHFCPDWRPMWLRNDGKDAIGLLPKATWTLRKNPKRDPQAPFLAETQSDAGKAKRPLASAEAFLRLLLDYQNRYPVRAAPKNAYQDGFMGYLSYDLGAFVLDKTAPLQDTPLAYFGHYPIHIAKQKDGWWLLTADGAPLQTSSALAQSLAQIAKKPLPTPRPVALSPLIQPSDYRDAFAKTQAYLLAGDAYQINLTQAWQGSHLDPLVLRLPSLFAKTKAPYAGFLAIDDFEIASASPELFLRFDRQSDGVRVTARPIKGTRRRASDPTEDARLKRELESSEKDRAENLMIVDLLRNDLGKHAKLGTVKTPTRFAVESFSNVHHMVSAVSATLKRAKGGALLALFDSLPAGSITGSPKKRACEIIHELEAAPRGAYCGTLGYLNFDESGAWNVLIRTAQSQKEGNLHRTRLWAGGGITVLSDGGDEYQESVDKIAQMQAIFLRPDA